MTSQEFDALYVRYQGEWVDLARRLTKDRDTAKDVVQNVMLYFVEKGLDWLDVTKNPESVVRQKIVWWIKEHIWLRKQNEKTVEQNLVRLDDLENRLEDRYDLDMDLDTQTPLESSIREAFKGLDAEEEAIVCLRVFGKVTWVEIASIMGLTRSTVWLRYTAGLQKLRLALESVGISGHPFGDSKTPARDQTAA